MSLPLAQSLPVAWEKISRTSTWRLMVPVTLLSFLLTGYVPVFVNNIYHIPIMLRLYDLPQFHDDPFVQSLRHYSSGFWLVSEGIGYIINCKLFLAVLLFINHLGFFIASVHMANSLGYRDNRQINLFLVLLLLSSLTVGVTEGGGGLMLNYFTHSELANVPLLLGLSFALRRQYAGSAVCTCVVFFLNAFMAVWMLPSLALVAAYQLISRSLSWASFGKACALGSAIGAAFLVAPIINIARNPEFGQVLHFSYRQYLWDFFPYHFYIQSLSGGQLLKLTALVLMLFLTAGRHGERSREFLAMSVGACLLLAVGSIVPEFTDYRLFMDLHLIRSAAVIALLAPISVALVSVQWLLSPVSVVQVRSRPALAGLMIAPVNFSPLIVPILLCERLFVRNGASARIATLSTAKAASWLVLALCACSVPVRAYNAIKYSIDQGEKNNIYERIGQWAGHETKPESVFLIKGCDYCEVGFEMTSRRKIYFAPMFGAAVMWSPSYYAVWENRKFTTSDASFATLLAHARKVGVDYLITYCAPAAPLAIAYTDSGVCVYGMKPATVVGRTRRPIIQN